MPCLHAKRHRFWCRNIFASSNKRIMCVTSLNTFNCEAQLTVFWTGSSSPSSNYIKSLYSSHREVQFPSLLAFVATNGKKFWPPLCQRVAEGLVSRRILSLSNLIEFGISDLVARLFGLHGVGVFWICSRFNDNCCAPLHDNRFCYFIVTVFLDCVENNFNACALQLIWPLNF
jgi:hypothetical protein